jgi:hypothetical protein
VLMGWEMAGRGGAEQSARGAVTVGTARVWGVRRGSDTEWGTIANQNESVEGSRSHESRPHMSNTQMGWCAVWFFDSCLCPESGLAVTR